MSYSLKSAEVVPIHKAEAKADISNYRPILLVSNTAKNFEKIMYNRLYGFLKNCNILSDSEYGFVKGKGTADALNNLLTSLFIKSSTSSMALYMLVLRSLIFYYLTIIYRIH